jgi:hypothetical protein
LFQNFIDMKKTLLLLAVVALTAVTSSCQKCATCTIKDADKGTLTSEVCSKGDAYDAAIKVHEDNDWTCAK